MIESRSHKAKKNIFSTLLRQLVATVCGIIVPRLMIGAYGSAIYGATTSIAQFLSYVTLFEGGIGRVGRGELYKPLAIKDYKTVSKIYRAVKAFFSKLGIAFIIYAVILALFYHDLANVTELDKTYTFFLVLVIAISTVANYMFGISNLTLMNADQKQYISNSIIMVTNILNTVFILILVTFGKDVLTVKLMSSLVFVMRPIAYALYVKKNYPLPKIENEKYALKQKWTGIGQHMAYFIHTNTDIILLTVMANLETVAVYSVYQMVSKSIWNIASSFSGGMEAAFGEMIARNENTELWSAYKKYKVLLTMVTIALFGSAIILVVPFVKLYTKGITDANYIQPIFAVLLLLAEAINCIILPCSSIPVSANKLKETRWGSYAEAIINIVLSCILIPWNPLLGVALGTLVATCVKGIYFITYTAKNILNCKTGTLLKPFIGAVLVLLFVSLFGMEWILSIPINNYFVWVLYGIVVFIGMSIITLLFCKCVYPDVTNNILKSIRRK